MVCVGELCIEYPLRKLVLTLVQAGVSYKWAYDGQRFLLEFFDTIHNSPSQIYHSILPLCPPSSWLYKSYTAELSGGFKVVKGSPAGWGTCFRTVPLSHSPQALAHQKDTIAVGLYSGDIVTLDGITGSKVAVLSGHSGAVFSLSFSSDGTLLVSGSDDKTLKLWDVQTGGVVKTFHGHTDRVISISISSNSTTIASGSLDYTIRLWDIGTGECYYTIEQEEIVDCVSFSPANPQHLISVSDNVVQWWDVSGCKIKPACEGSYAAFSLDGTHFALCGKKATTVHNSDSGVIVAKCPTDIDPAYCCFSPNGKLVAIATGATAYIWDITGSHPHLIETFIGHSSDINSLTFTSSSLISASYDNSVNFWEVDASSTDLVTSNSESTPLASVPIESVSLQAESGISISTDLDGVVRIWDITTGLCKASFQTPSKGESWRDAQMVDGRLIVVWLKGSEGIHIWDTKKGELLRVVKTDRLSPRDLRISGDGSKVFLLDQRFIQAWSMWTGEAVGSVDLEDESYLDLLRMGGSRICLRFPNSPIQGWDFGVSGSSPVPLPNASSESPSLSFIGAASWRYQGPLWIKDRVTGKLVFELPGRYARPYDVQWDGRYLVTGYGSGEVLILDFNQMLPQ
jgi:WD40 repeat protein